MCKLVAQFMLGEAASLLRPPDSESASSLQFLGGEGASLLHTSSRPTPSLQACCSSRAVKVQACCTRHRGRASRLGVCKPVACSLPETLQACCIFPWTGGHRGTSWSCAQRSSPAGTEENVPVRCDDLLHARLGESLFLQLVSHWMLYPLDPSNKLQSHQIASKAFPLRTETGLVPCRSSSALLSGS